MRQIVETLTGESQRAQDWIEHDRTRYWPNQMKKSENLVAAARGDLERCKLNAMKDEKRSCVEEQKNVERAVARLRHCEQQVRVVRQWRHLIRHHGDEFAGKVARLAHYLDTDMPRAIAAMDRIIRALETYTETQSSSSAARTVLPSSSEADAATDDLDADGAQDAPSAK